MRHYSDSVLINDEPTARVLVCSVIPGTSVVFDSVVSAGCLSVISFRKFLVVESIATFNRGADPTNMVASRATIFRGLLELDRAHRG